MCNSQSFKTSASISSVEHIETKDQQQTTLPKEYNSETTILYDSNGHLLDTNLLCPRSTTSYIRCSVLAQSKDIINEVIFNAPKTFILHCGTNDLEKYHDYTGIVKKISEVINLINEKYLESKVILSSLLPRMDTHHAQVGKINKVLNTNYSTKPSVLFVEHNNFSPRS